MERKKSKSKLSQDERSALSRMINAFEAELRLAGDGPGWNSLEELEHMINRHVTESPEGIRKYLEGQVVTQEVWGSHYQLMHSIVKGRGVPEGAPRGDFDACIVDLDEASKAFVIGVKEREDQLRSDMKEGVVERSLGDVMRARLMPMFHGNGGYGKRFSNPGWIHDTIARETKAFAEERIALRLDQKSVDNQVAMMANDLAVHAVKSKSIQGLSNFDEIMANAKKAAKIAKATLAKNGTSAKREMGSFSP